MSALSPAVVCSSHIAEVVVHARGALVRRRVAPPALPDGDVDLLVPGLTVLAEAGSVRVELPAKTQRQVVALQTSLDVPSAQVRLGQSAERSRRLGAEIARKQAEVARLEARRAELAEVRPDPSLIAAARTERVAQRVEEALAAAALARELLEQTDARLQSLLEELRKLEEEKRAADLELSQAATGAKIERGHPTQKVRLRLSGAGALDVIDLLYVVPAARWWPVYTLRLSDGGKRAAWWMEALVAQRTAEDWTGVALAVSTADLVFDTRLPELPSLRLGRAQPPPRRGYRPAPAGLEAMFAPYDRAFPSGTTVEQGEEEAVIFAAEPAPIDSLVADERARRRERKKAARRDAKERAHGGDDISLGATRGAMPPMEEGGAMAEEAFAPPAGAAYDMPASASYAQGAPFDGAPPMPQSMPMPPARAAAPRGGFGGAGMRAEMAKTAGAPPAPPPPEPPVALQPVDALLDFDALRMGGADDRSHRGRLVPARDSNLAARRTQAQREIDGLSPRPGVADPAVSRGMFDHRYAADGKSDVPSDGLPHRVSLGAADGPSTPRLRAVPREAPEVYREVELVNPFDAPLLTGPVDVYLDGSLLLTTGIERIDRGGTFRVGLGVEERVRVARNARVEESSAGLLGGSTAVQHHVTIELTSSLTSAIRIDVLDRVPVTDDKNVKIEKVVTKPEAEAYKQAELGRAVRGGLRWRVELAPAGKSTLTLEYRITLPAKNEIVGGNRRE